MARARSNTTHGNEGDEPSRPLGAPGPAEELGATLVAALAHHGVAVDRVPPRSLRFRAVPVGEPFSKPRTNMLFQRISARGGCSIYVDSDLDYTGSDAMVLQLLTGPSRRNWRRLCLPPVPGPPGEVLCAILEMFGSPIAADARSALGASSPDPGAAEREPLGRMLAATGEIVEPAAAAEAFETSTRKELATRLAVIATRPAPPQCAVLWGTSGCGRDHLLLAAAHLLLEGDCVRRVLRICGGKVAAGCIFPADLDSALMQLLAEAEAQEECLLLIEDIDVCVSGSPASHSLLCSAMDHGLRFLATAHSPAGLQRLRRDEALARRLVGVPLRPPTREQVAGVLEHFAEVHGVDVAPAALQAALNLARKLEVGEPAASLGLLAAAIAEALWRGDDKVHPDDVLAFQQDEWPEEPDDEKE